MRVLVVYGSRHGATAGIAARIGSVLANEGLAVDIHTSADAQIMERGSHLDRYDAFVIGSGLYAGHWLGETRDFVRRNSHMLITRPVWLFGSGPLGDKTTDDKGHDLLKPPPEMLQLADQIAARECHIFFGAYDPTAEPVGLMEGLMERFTRLAPSIKDALPAGDFRNWDEIETWSRSIARELTEIPVAV